MGWPKPSPGPRGWSGHPKRPKKKKKNERMRFGLWGWPDHPLGPGGGFGHPLPAVGGGFGHLHALGGGPATPKGPKKKKKGKNGFWPLGVAGPPPRAWRWPKPPPTAGRGCPKPPPGPRGWSGHPQRPKRILSFFFGPFGVAGPPPRAWGWLRPPHTDRWGWLEPPPWPKMGWSGHPTFGKGVAPATPISSFFFFFFFSISFFFFKKKKKKNLKCKTTPFCPKRLRFGRAQNGVVLEWRVVWAYIYLYTHYTLEGS
jgi:hypothetical protein